MNDDLLNEFITEAEDHLGRGEAILLALGRATGADPEAVNACFRSLHTVKGCAGFLELERIQRLSHAGEQVLDALRSGRRAPGQDVYDLLLATISRLREHLGALAGSGREDGGDDQPLIRDLDALLATPPTPAAVPSPAAAPAATGVTVVAAPAAQPGETFDDLLAQMSLTGIPQPPAPAPAPAPAITGPSPDACLADLLAAGPDPAFWRPALARFAAAAAGDPGAASTALRMQTAAAAPAADDAARYDAVLAAAMPDATRPATPRAGGDALADFVGEANDLLAQAEATVVGHPALGADDIHAVFRAFHTIKGMAAYLGLAPIEHAAHAVEAQLQPVRDGERPADEAFAATALAGVDTLRRLVRGEAVMAETAPVSAPAPVAPAETPRIGDLLVEQGVPRPVVERVAADLPAGQRLGDKLVEEGRASREQVEQAARAQQGMRAGDGFSRVATAKLEDLMNMVGELLIAQAMVEQDGDLAKSPRLAQAVGRQGRILRDLQVLSLSLRMVPLRATFQKMARAVHDTARKLGKKIDLQLGGEDTEIDRTLAETMADPLLHMVRNAVDHGVEMPDARCARGKPECGRLRLEAYHAGDDVVITLADDGAGMDPQRLKAKAVEKGLLAPDAVLDDQQCFDLIFLPGFSTAAKVTDVSGRGVGMDVVRRQVQAANGSVRIDSVQGQGTTFTIRLPLTTAILDAMLLACAQERLLIPVASIVEMLRPAPGQVQTVLAGGRVIDHRGRTLPVVALGERFGFAGCECDPARALLLVVENQGSDYALLVDAVLGQRQIVIKPLERGMPHHAGVSGTAILGDGRVALIINPARLVAGDRGTVAAQESAA